MASTVPTYDFCVRSGNTGTTDNETGLVLTVADASDYVWHLKTGSFTGGPITKTSPGDITISGDTVTIPLTLTDNSDLEGLTVSYEVERRDSGAGTQRTVLLGTITGIAGITDD